MTHFGVQRLILINSGNYGFAEFDLSTAVHLAAPNNQGKTTLVNSLQFLYINDIRNMSFGNTVEETSKHYFGSKISYLVFECATPLGIKSLLVRGLSKLRAGRFERYIFEGGFVRDDFLENDGTVREFSEVQVALADRHLTKVANSDLWKVLSGREVEKHDTSGGLKILPIRNQSEYGNFCRVYKKLLTLADLDADTLRELLIACHSRDIAEKSVDIATDYREEFEIAERSENELAFIRSVVGLIERGISSREKVAILNSVLIEKVPDVWHSADKLNSRLLATEATLATTVSKLCKAKTEESQHSKELHTQKGGIVRDLKLAEDEFVEIEKEHQNWTGYSDSIIETMRMNASSLEIEIAIASKRLAQVAKLDADSIENELGELRKRLFSQQRAFDNWDKTFAAYLKELGFSQQQLDLLFRIFNRSANAAIVGEDIKIKDAETLVARCNEILARVSNSKYQDAEVAIELANLESIDLATLQDRAHLQNRIRVTETDLKEKENQLEIAQNRKAAEDKLEEKKSDLRNLNGTLQAFDSFAKRWRERGKIESKVEDAQTELEDIRNSIRASEERETEIASRIATLEKQTEACTTKKSELRTKFRELQNELESLGLHLDLIPFHEIPNSETRNDVRDSEKLDDTLDRIGEKIEDADRLVKDAKDVAKHVEVIRACQIEIATRSRKFPSQQLYFENSDEEWASLGQKAESLNEMQATTQKAWNDLFVRVGGRLDGLLRSVREIQTAVQHVNRGLSKYKVSNLQNVELKVNKDNRTYPVIAELCREDGLFQDRDEIENAKRQLQKWIISGEVIQLDSLFALQISGSQSDGSPIRASSLDKIGSTGTGITIKAMILCQLIRAITPDPSYRLHFFIDETGRLDDPNLSATTQLAVSNTVIPITAEPKVKMESLAHPDVTIYTLGQDAKRQFRIESHRTFRARRIGVGEASTAQ